MHCQTEWKEIHPCVICPRSETMNQSWQTCRFYLHVLLKHIEGQTSASNQLVSKLEKSYITVIKKCIWNLVQPVLEMKNKWPTCFLTVEGSMLKLSKPTSKLCWSKAEAWKGTELSFTLKHKCLQSDSSFLLRKH